MALTPDHRVLTTIVLVALFALPGSGQVLCFGADGRVAVEPALLPGACGGCPDSEPDPVSAAESKSKPEGCMDVDFESEWYVRARRDGDPIGRSMHSAPLAYLADREAMLPNRLLIRSIGDDRHDDSERLLTLHSTILLL